MTSTRDLQRSRAAQVGFVMRSYRESFIRKDGRRGLTQDELLQRMATTDDAYTQRYSHATVSRWESGQTRPDVHRIRVFGAALNLSATDVAGLILLAGLASDFETASNLATTDDPAAIIEYAKVDDEERPARDTQGESRGESTLRGLAGFVAFRTVPLGLGIAGLGFILSFLDWSDAFTPVVYVGLVLGLVLLQGFVFPGRKVPLREFFWVSVFLLLTTPLIQFAPILMDHYSFYRLGDFAGTPAPYVLALLLNLVLASLAGMIFHVQWKRQYLTDGVRSNAVRRAAWVVLPPLFLVYAIVVVITNLSVTIQLSILVPVLAAGFGSLLLMRDPTLNPGERERSVLFPIVAAATVVSSVIGLATVIVIYASPDLPSILPDHNLLSSWEINFDELGYTRNEALDRINMGYVLHAMCLLIYILFVVGSRVLVDLYRIGGDGLGASSHSNAGSVASQDGPAPAPLRAVLSLTLTLLVLRTSLPQALSASTAVPTALRVFPVRLSRIAGRATDHCHGGSWSTTVATLDNRVQVLREICLQNGIHKE